MGVYAVYEQVSMEYEQQLYQWKHVPVRELSLQGQLCAS